LGLLVLFTCSGQADSAATFFIPQPPNEANADFKYRSNPAFPSTCPYVTSVGATQLLNGTSVRGSESACQRVIFSGGGFSNFFPMPSYQSEAVAAYFADNEPPYSAERYNNSKNVRAYPDVAANGANYVTAVNGNFSLSFGTSGKQRGPRATGGVDFLANPTPTQRRPPFSRPSSTSSTRSGSKRARASSAS